MRFGRTAHDRSSAESLAGTLAFVYMIAGLIAIGVYLFRRVRPPPPN
jgi:hypothetical protein